MNRREADAEAWERGEHPCQTRGHSPSRDPQIAECGYCGADLTVPEDERVRTALAVVVGPVKPDADGNFAAGPDGAVFTTPAFLADEGDAGQSTCPICRRTWTVTAFADCFIPACGCYGNDVTAANPNRPCESCGLSHAWTCKKRPDRDGDTR